MWEKVKELAVGIGALALYVGFFGGIIFLASLGGDDTASPSVGASDTTTAVDEIDTSSGEDESEPDNCNTNYEPCIPDSASDLDCADVGEQVTVVGRDEYGLDRDGDGIGCESY